MKYSLFLMLLVSMLFVVTDSNAQSDASSDLTEISTQFDIPATGVFIAPTSTDEEGQTTSNFSTSVTTSTGINSVQSAVERRTRNLSNKATVDYEHPTLRVKDWELPDEQTAESRLYAYQSPNENPPDSGTTVSDADPDEGRSFPEWLRANWLAFVLGLMGFLKVIVNLTPTDVDNKVFTWLDRILNIIPNRKTGGGTHPTA